MINFGSGGFEVYLNGVLQQSSSHTGGLGTSSGGAGNHEPITFAVSQQKSGNQTTGGWDQPFNGHIDEVAIYSRAFAPEEVQWLYDQVLAGAAENGAILRDPVLSF